MTIQYIRESSNFNICNFYTPEYLKVLHKFHKNNKKNQSCLEDCSKFERILDCIFDKIDNAFMTANNFLERLTVSNSAVSLEDDVYPKYNNLQEVNVVIEPETDNCNVFTNTSSDYNRSLNNNVSNDITIYFLRNIKSSLHSRKKVVNRYGLTNDETAKFKKSIITLFNQI